MKGRIQLFGSLVALAALLVYAAPASATHVQCGDVLTTSTTLDSDVVCPDEAQLFGLAIGADNVLLRLNGYAIRAGAAGGTTGIASASPDQDGLQGVRIKRGSVEGFLAGIDLGDADDTIIFKVNITTMEAGGDAGILLRGDRNSVYQSTITLNGEEGSPGIDIIGPDAYAWGNVVTGTATTGSGVGHSGIVTFGQNPRVIYNQVTNCAPSGLSGAGVLVDGYFDAAVVNRNSVSGCAEGVFVRWNGEGYPGGARIALNQTTGGVIGIRVADPAGKVRANTARDAVEGGFLIDTAGTFVRDNGAFDNGLYGINAADGVVDGGGNVASGNGDGSAPQCINVECSEPPPPT
jgi:hypothetical protein